MPKGRKRAQPAPEAPEPAQGPIVEPELTPYELERQALIARNRARLAEIGVPLAAQELSAVAPIKQPKPRKARKKSESQPAQPTKRSSRLKGEKLDDVQGIDEEEEEEEDVKPQKKSRSSQSSSKPSNAGPRHPTLPSQYTGVKGIQLTEEERRQQEQMLAFKENDKMAAIQLEGLVDWTDEKAVFVVRGSRGDNYLVTITDTKNTCQCMDHRIRKRDCKHINMVKANLGLNQLPINWRQAVHEKFMMTQEDRVKKGLEEIAAAMGVEVPSNAPSQPGGGEAGTSNQAQGAGTSGQGRAGGGTSKQAAAPAAAAAAAATGAPGEPEGATGNEAGGNYGMAAGGPAQQEKEEEGEGAEAEEPAGTKAQGGKRGGNRGGMRGGRGGGRKKGGK